MMDVFIPDNNNLRSEILELIKLCEEVAYEYGDRASHFMSLNILIQ